MSNAKVIGKITPKLKICGSVKYSTGGGGGQSNVVLPKSIVTSVFVSRSYVSTSNTATIEEV